MFKANMIRIAGGVCISVGASLPAQAQAQAAGDTPPYVPAGVPAAAQDLAAGDASPAASAQPAGTGDAAKPASAAGAPSQLEEIVVTATKRSQTVREVPETINVMTGARLESKGARELKDFIDLVPGIKVTDATGDSPQKIAIRGVGPDETTNQTVATVIGDVSLSDPYGSFTVIDPDPWDLKNVEVLKGPQGTLFGASSLNGMIRYVPNTPVLGTWEGKAFAEWDAVKNGGVEPTFGAALNVPIGSTLALRVSGVAQHAPGYIDFENPSLVARNGNDFHKASGRAMALWQPTDRLSINAWYMQQRQTSDETNVLLNQDGQFNRIDAPASSPQKQGFSLATLDVRYKFDWATLVSLTARQTKENIFNLEATYQIPGEAVAQSGLSVTRALRQAQAHGLVQEFRLVSPDEGPWTWLGGVFASRYKANTLSDIYLNNTAATAPILKLLPFNLGSLIGDGNGVSLENQALNPVNASEVAAFGELSRTIWDSLKVTLGARLYRTDVSGNVYTSGLLYTALNGSAGDSRSVSVPAKGFSPKASVTYRLNPNIFFYTTASRGYQYGGINVANDNSEAIPLTFSSSTVWNYEGGVRTDWFKRSVRFDLTAFYLDWKNAQVNQATSDGLNSFVANVGSVRSRGFEETFQYLPPFLKGLSFEVAGSYTEAKTMVPFVSGNGSVVPTGTYMPYSPVLQTAATLAYRRLFSEAWRFGSSLEYTHQNTSWNDIEHDHLLQGRDILNLNLSVTRSDLEFAPSISLTVNNLTNQHKTIYIRDGANTLSTTQPFTPTAYTQPRTILLRFGMDF